MEDLTGWFDENPDVKSQAVPVRPLRPPPLTARSMPCPTQTVQPDRPLLQQGTLRQGRRPAAQDLGRADGPGTKTFNDMGIAPLSLGGQSTLDVHDVAGVPGGPHRRPRSLHGHLRRQGQGLVRSRRRSKPAPRSRTWCSPDGFIKGFSSITADSNADQALLFTGKAAMMLHGGWIYGSMKNDGADVRPERQAGLGHFPTVSGGKGDPAQRRGQPRQLPVHLGQGHRLRRRRQPRSTSRTDCSPTDEIAAYIDSGAVPDCHGHRGQAGRHRRTRTS